MKIIPPLFLLLEIGFLFGMLFGMWLSDGRHRWPQLPVERPFETRTYQPFEGVGPIAP